MFLIKIQKILEYGLPLIVFLSVLVFGFILRKILFGRLVRWAEKTNFKIADIIINSLKGPFIIWFLMLAIYFSLEALKLPPRVVEISGKILLILSIFSVTLVLANILTRLVKLYSEKTYLPLPATSLTQNIIRIVILIIGALIILNTLGISITPILATLGIGGLAVALALQDTLSNLFAGFYITLTRHIQIGDFIKLESGEEGYVLDIGWRATRVRTLPNNVVLIPNNKLAQSTITNYSLPEKELAVLVQAGVHYNSDLEHVEKVTIEVAREVMREVQGGVPEFEPFIRYHTFGDFSINFTVILRAKEFVNQHLIKHEFIKRLHKRFAQEGIIIPYPIRAIDYKQQEAK